MSERGELVYMQYIMRREEVCRVADAFEEALAEDHQNNADMFDITRVNFSNNPHPNATMRVLEDTLAEKDLPFLHMLFGLLRVGADLSLALAEFDSIASFVDAVAQEIEFAELHYTDAAYLANELTAPKAEHQLKRLRAAIDFIR